jgi:L-lactate utilization protein LutB
MEVKRGTRWLLEDEGNIAAVTNVPHISVVV